MFHAILRPGQGFRPFLVLVQQNGIAANGRPTRNDFIPVGQITGLLMRASPSEVQQWKPRNQWQQEGHPVTYKIIQYCGAANTPLYALLPHPLAPSLDQSPTLSPDSPAEPSLAPSASPVVRRAKPTDILQLVEPAQGDQAAKARFFWVQGVHEPAEWGHFIVYYAQEREDLQYTPNTQEQGDLLC